MAQRAPRPEPPTIMRLWHGWTRLADADLYEQLLLTRILPDIRSRGLDGLTTIQVLRRPVEADEVEFVTLMTFDSLDAVRAFAGADYERAVVPPAARALLSRFDANAMHYEIKHTI